MWASWELSAPNLGILPFQYVLELLQCLEPAMSGDPTAVCCWQMQGYVWFSLCLPKSGKGVHAMGGILSAKILRTTLNSPVFESINFTHPLISVETFTDLTVFPICKYSIQTWWAPSRAIKWVPNSCLMQSLPEMWMDWFWVSVCPL